MCLRRPSLNLLDKPLPDIDGMELPRYLKDGDKLGDIPAAVVSAAAAVQRVEGPLTAGATHYVNKPVNLVAVLAVLDEPPDDQDTHFGQPQT